MDLSSLEIRFGTLKDVLGQAVAHHGIRFVPAKVDFSGYENGPTLADAAAASDASVRAVVNPGEDAPWVSGRIQRVFLQRQIPEEDRGEKCCMWFTFLAVTIDGDSAVAIPFVCSDHYGKSLLLFGDVPAPDAATMQTIADAFWSLLLENPNDLIDYVDRMEHPGAGVTIEFGIEDGAPFMRELPD